MLPALEKAVSSLDMTEELAGVLSTPRIAIEHQGYDVEVAPSRRARAEE